MKINYSKARNYIIGETFSYKMLSLYSASKPYSIRNLVIPKPQSQIDSILFILKSLPVKYLSNWNIHDQITDILNP